MSTIPGTMKRTNRKHKRASLEVRGRIRMAITASERSQQSVALGAGMTPSNLSNFLNGNKDIRIGTYLRLCKALRIPS